MLNKNAVAYLRVSSEGQSEDGFSLDDQIQKIKVYALANNINLDNKNIYKDVESGSDPERTDLMKLKEIVLNPNNQINYVLVYAIDRWTRNAVDGLMLYKEFSKHKISLISVSESFDSNTSIGRFMCGILHLLAELNKDNIIEKLTAGKRQMIQQTGKWAGGISPYGYQSLGRRKKRQEEAIINGRGQLLLNEKESEMIRLIYDLRDKNYTYEQICETLSIHNYYNRLGNKFNKATIFRILKRREVYNGKKHINTSIELNEEIKPQQPSILNA